MRIIRLVCILAAFGAVTGCESASNRSTIGSVEVQETLSPAVAYVTQHLTASGGAVPVHVQPLDPLMPFSRAYHQYLTSQLTQAGVPVSPVRGGGLSIRYDVQPIAYVHEPTRFAPVFTALGAGAGGAAEVIDSGSNAVWAGLAAGAGLDLAGILASYEQRHAGDGNVIVTTQVLNNGAVVWSDSISYLVPEPELANYLAWSSSPAIPARATATADLPEKAMAMTGPGVADERAERIFRRSLRK